MFEFLRRWCDGSSRVRQTSTRGRKHQSRPRLEILEERLAPGVVDVASLADFLPPPGGNILLGSTVEADSTINLSFPGAYCIKLPAPAREVDDAAGVFGIAACGGYLTFRNSRGAQRQPHHDPRPEYDLGHRFGDDADGDERR